MEILSGILFGAINVAFFMIGYYFGSKKEKAEGVVLDKDNVKSVEDFLKWMNYRG